MIARSFDTPFVIPPLAMRELLKRVEIGRKNRRRVFWRRAAKRMHRACIGRETIESNLPLV
jgi:hypothetical protein